MPPPPEASAHLAARFQEALAQCRADLADLRTACSAAKSYKPECARLSAAAAAAVTALEAVHAAGGGSLQSSPAAQQLAVRVQGALDQGYALAQTHGAKAFAVKLFSSVPSRFEATSCELANLARRAQHEAQRPLAQAREAAAAAEAASTAQAAAAAAAEAAVQAPPSPRERDAAAWPAGSSAHGSAAGSSATTAAAAAAAAGGAAAGAAAAEVVQGTVGDDDAGASAAAAAAAANGGEDGDEEETEAAFGETFAQLLIPWEELERVRPLREQQAGEVWLGRWQETDVTIKLLAGLDAALGLPSASLQRDSSGAIRLTRRVRKMLEREGGLMQEVRHPNVALFMGVALDPPAVVMEYCSRGTLFNLLGMARNNPRVAASLDWPCRLGMALDVTKGMLYLHGHRPPIIHRDLKSQHIVVAHDWCVKVSGFSLAKESAAGSSSGELAPAASAASAGGASISGPFPSSESSELAVDPRWLAPEVIREQLHSAASDMFAFGLTLWELLTWEPPFADLSPFQVMVAVGEQGARPPVPDEAAAGALSGGSFAGLGEYCALMRRCWAERPQDRPTFEQVAADLRRIIERLPAHTRSNAEEEELAC